MADKMVYFDTHAHWSYPYKNKDFYENRHEYLKRVYAAESRCIRTSLHRDFYGRSGKSGLSKRNKAF